MNRSTAALLLGAFALLMIPACAQHEQPIISSALLKFSQEWKPASPHEKGLILQRWLPDTVAWHLRGKIRQQVLELLGSPDRADPSNLTENSPAQAQFLLYRCGNLNGPYDWAMIVTINYEGKVVACKMQQDTSDEKAAGIEEKAPPSGKEEPFGKIELVPQDEESPPAKKGTPPEEAPKTPAH